MTYKELMTEAEAYYRKIAQNSPFCAMFEAREYIASKIDLCEDRNEHLDVLEWKEYKEKYAPMTKAEYERRKNVLLEQYQNGLKRLEEEYEDKGKNSPDYHKI